MANGEWCVVSSLQKKTSQINLMAYSYFMSTRRDYTLDEEQLSSIQQAMNHDRRPVVRRRAQAIYLLHTGHKPKAVAEMVAVERRTVYYWHDAWLSEGVEGLARKPGSGRKPKATPAYCRLLEETLDKEPSELGYDFTVWTIDRLRSYLAQETNIELSARAFSDLLKRLDYVYRRPKHDLKHLQDPEVIAQAEKQLEAFKKSPSTAILSSSLWTKRSSN